MLKDQVMQSLTSKQQKVIAVAFLGLASLTAAYSVYPSRLVNNFPSANKEGSNLIPFPSNDCLDEDQFKEEKISPSSLISQADYLAYKHALDRIYLERNKRHRIEIINQMHAKLLRFEKEQTAGEYLLAADLYNTSLKIMQTWNRLKQVNSDELQIYSPHVTDSTDLKTISIKAQPLTESEKALKRYFEVLTEFPQLKREGENNDHDKETYEIFYDLKNIQEVQELTYQALYNKTQSHEQAATGSMIGIVYEDRWAMLIRDAVQSPSGKKHTYIRFVWKSQFLGTEAGAGIMPLVQTKEGIKIGLILTNRHSTSWELEIPRGASAKGEAAAETAKRELEEEMGYKIDNSTYLGRIAPDTGILSSVIPVFEAYVTGSGEAKPEKTEAIKGTFLFSLDEIKAALKNKDDNGTSFLEVSLNGEKKRIPLRDSFLIFALLQHQLLEESKSEN
jgi:8-oxo-dGTP pyrophosphatase MutT (NUDIX family)